MLPMSAKFSKPFFLHYVSLILAIFWLLIKVHILLPRLSHYFLKEKNDWLSNQYRLINLCIVRILILCVGNYSFDQPSHRYFVQMFLLLNHWIMRTSISFMKYPNSSDCHITDWIHDRRLPHLVYNDIPEGKEAWLEKWSSPFQNIAIKGPL